MKKTMNTTAATAAAINAIATAAADPAAATATKPAADPVKDATAAKQPAAKPAAKQPAADTTAKPAKLYTNVKAIKAAVKVWNENQSSDPTKNTTAEQNRIIASVNASIDKTLATAATAAENAVSYFAKRYEVNTIQFTDTGFASYPVKRTVYAPISAYSAADPAFSAATDIVYKNIVNTVNTLDSTKSLSNTAVKRICTPLNVPLNAYHCEIFRIWFNAHVSIKHANKKHGVIAELQPINRRTFENNLSKLLYIGYNAADVTAKIPQNIAKSIDPAADATAAAATQKQPAAAKAAAAKAAADKAAAENAKAAAAKDAQKAADKALTKDICKKRVKQPAKDATAKPAADPAADPAAAKQQPAA